MQWLDEKIRADEIKKVLFVARDGYTLEKVFNLIKIFDSKAYYVYFPRKFPKNVYMVIQKKFKTLKKSIYFI